MNKNKKLGLTLPLALLVSPVVLPIVVACAANNKLAKLEPYLAALDRLLARPEELVAIGLKPAPTVAPNQYNLSVNEILTKPIDEIFVLNRLAAWDQWNDKINNDPKLTEQERELVRLTKSVLQTRRIPTLVSGGTDIQQLKLNVNLSNGHVSNNTVALEFDFSNIILTKHEPIERQISENDVWWRILKAAIERHIERKAISKTDVENDPARMRFKLEKEDFAREYESLFQENIAVFFDQKLTDASEINVLAYFADELQDSEPAVKQYFYAEITGIRLS